MAIGNIDFVTPRQISTTTLLFTGSGTLRNIFCSSSSAGTATIYDSATAANNNKIVDTFSLTAGTSYNLPYGYANGLYVVLGGTASITVGML